MIVIIGAGLAGLSAARSLLEAGCDDFCLLEKLDIPGGRVRTIDHEGFRLDLGFQVALDSYPAIRSHFPAGTVERCYFGSGALVEESRGNLNLLANPLRHPGKLANGLVSRLSWPDRLRLLRFVLTCLTRSDDRLLRETGTSSRDELKRRGFSDEMIRCFFEPFFGGVFLDGGLETDVSLLRYYMKMFTLGRAFVPQGGMGELGGNLANILPQKVLRYGVAVRSLEAADGIVSLLLDDGTRMPADAVIVATDPATTCRLLGWPEPGFRDTHVLYFSSSRPVYDGPWLVLPSAKPRRAQHFVQLSNIDRSLAPPGRQLLSATVLDPGDVAEDALFATVKQEVTRLFPETGPGLVALKRIVVCQALPVQNSEFRNEYLSRLSNLPPGVHVAGDLVSNASIQNALESGQRAAADVLAGISLKGSR